MATIPEDRYPPDFEDLWAKEGSRFYFTCSAGFFPRNQNNTSPATMSFSIVIVLFCCSSQGEKKLWAKLWEFNQRKECCSCSLQFSIHLYKVVYTCLCIKSGNFISNLIEFHWTVFLHVILYWQIISTAQYLDLLESRSNCQCSAAHLAVTLGLYVCVTSIKQLCCMELLSFPKTDV